MDPTKVEAVVKWESLKSAIEIHRRILSVRKAFKSLSEG